MEAVNRSEEILKLRLRIEQREALRSLDARLRSVRMSNRSVVNGLGLPARKSIVRLHAEAVEVEFKNLAQRTWGTAVSAAPGCPNAIDIAYNALTRVLAEMRQRVTKAMRPKRKTPDPRGRLGRSAYYLMDYAVGELLRDEYRLLVLEHQGATLPPLGDQSIEQLQSSATGSVHEQHVKELAAALDEERVPIRAVSQSLIRNRWKRSGPMPLVKVVTSHMKGAGVGGRPCRQK